MKDYIPPNLLQKAREMDLLTYLKKFNPVVIQHLIT